MEDEEVYEFDRQSFNALLATALERVVQYNNSIARGHGADVLPLVFTCPPAPREYGSLREAAEKYNSAFLPSINDKDDSEVAELTKQFEDTGGVQDANAMLDDSIELLASSFGTF